MTSESTKRTLSIDSGDTNFGVALFHGQKMVTSEARSTLRDTGPRWMLDQMEFDPRQLAGNRHPGRLRHWVWWPGRFLSSG